MAGSTVARPCQRVTSRVRSWPALAPSPVRGRVDQEPAGLRSEPVGTGDPHGVGSADARSPPLRPAEATITVAIKRAQAVILRPVLH